MKTILTISKLARGMILAAFLSAFSWTGILAQGNCIADFTFAVNGNSVSFTNTSTGGANPHYTWNFGDGHYDSAKNPVHAFQKKGTYAVCLGIMDSSLSCYDTICLPVVITSDCDSITIIRNGTNPSSPASCDGAVNVTGIIGGVAPYVFTWSPNVSNSSSAVNLCGGSYNITVTDAMGCTGTTQLSILDTSSQNCQAAFILNTNNNVVTFTNASTGGTSATSYSWHFGDGNYSNLTNPNHTYQYNGTYNVCLTMGDTLQTCYSYYCDTVVVTGGMNPPCYAMFYYSNIDTSIGSNSVYFYNASSGNPISWTWNFGDNTSSNLQNPGVHQYAQPGTYNVCLTITTADSSSCSYCYPVIVTGSSCHAMFNVSFNPTATNTVFFSDASTSTGNIGTWTWDFGDGNYSNLTNPSHTYQYNGTYYVCLTIIDSLQPCYDRYCDTIVITGGINPPCHALFYSHSDSTSSNGVVYFYNASTGNPISWAWNFGDNTTSNLQNPVHQYAQAGTYNVCLTITTADSTSCTYCNVVVIGSINPPCNAMFYYYPDSISNNNTVYFYDVSTGPPISWTWNFGDNTTSNLQHPVHQYAQAGTYNVCLTITTADSVSCTYCRVVSIGINPPCNALFVSHVDSIPGIVSFYDASNANSVSWAWDFGDNNTSSLQHPVHQYTQPGVYRVCLTVTTNDSTSCSYCDTVRVDSLIVGGCSANLYLYQDTTIINSQTWYLYSHVTGVAPFTYLWDFGDGNTSTQQYPVHNYVVSGHYAICLTITDATGCTFTTCDSTYKLTSQGIIGQLVVVPSTTSVNDYVIAVNSIYPNPANDIVSISFNKLIEGELRMLDMTGREVYNEKINANNVKINVSNFPVGFYDLSIVAGDKISHNKIAIMR